VIPCNQATSSLTNHIKVMLWCSPITDHKMRSSRVTHVTCSVPETYAHRYYEVIFYLSVAAILWISVFSVVSLLDKCPGPMVKPTYLDIPAPLRSFYQPSLAIPLRLHRVLLQHILNSVTLISMEDRLLFNGLFYRRTSLSRQQEVKSIRILIMQ